MVAQAGHTAGQNLAFRPTRRDYVGNVLDDNGLVDVVTPHSMVPATVQDERCLLRLR
jgi:hypothetical protein